MFGYVTADIKGLSKEERATYKAHYCGLCHVLKERYGSIGTSSLSYDMTFLEMLLSDLNDRKETEGSERCSVHPIKEHTYIYTDSTGYAADMQMLLGYYSLLDNIHDEGKGEKEEEKYRAIITDINNKYPRQSDVLKSSLKEINAKERENSKDAEALALLTGTFLGEIFVDDESSFFRDDLRTLGCGLGRFIYLLDAWCDRKKDRKKGRFNPLSDDIKREEMKEMLLDAAAAASSAFERLPLDQHVSIMRNILYSGIWMRFEVREKND